MRPSCCEPPQHCPSSDRSRAKCSTSDCLCHPARSHGIAEDITDHLVLPDHMVSQGISQITWYRRGYHSSHQHGMCDSGLTLRHDAYQACTAGVAWDTMHTKACTSSGSSLSPNWCISSMRRLRHTSRGLTMNGALNDVSATIVPLPTPPKSSALISSPTDTSLRAVLLVLLAQGSG